MRSTDLALPMFNYACLSSFLIFKMNYETIIYVFLKSKKTAVRSITRLQSACGGIALVFRNCWIYSELNNLMTGLTTVNHQITLIDKGKAATSHVMKTCGCSES